jgi:hypothetical protein
MPMGIKDLKEELAEMNLKLGELTKELKETKNTIRESLNLTSDSLKEMMSEFSKSLKEAMNKMADMSIHMNVRDNILENLGLDKLLPDFLKKKKL